MMIGQNPSKRLLEKLNNRDDIDTTILKKEIVNLNGHYAIHEKWRWDGVLGESIVLDLNDEDILSEDEIISLLVQFEFMDSIDTKHTFRSSDDNFLFVNFNLATY